MVVFPKNIKGGFRNLRAGTCRLAQLTLARKAVELAVADIDPHHHAAHSDLSQPQRHALGEQIEHDPHVLVVQKIARRGAAVPHRFDRLHMVARPYRRRVKPQCKGLEREPHLPEPTRKPVFIALGKLSDGIDANAPQLGGRRRSDIEQILHRQRIDDLTVVIGHDACDSVRLFVIRAQLCGDLVVCHANADRDPQLKLHALADLLRNLHRRAEQLPAPRNIQPRLIQAERLDEVGVGIEYLPQHDADPHIFGVIRRHDDKLRAGLFRLPYCLPRLHAALLGRIARGQHDPVPLLLITANGDRPATQLRCALLLYGCVKGVGVHMQYLTPHAGHLLLTLYRYHRTIVRLRQEEFTGKPVQSSIIVLYYIW